MSIVTTTQNHRPHQLSAAALLAVLTVSLLGCPRPGADVSNTGVGTGEAGQTAAGAGGAPGDAGAAAEGSQAGASAGGAGGAGGRGGAGGTGGIIEDGFVRCPPALIGAACGAGKVCGPPERGWCQCRSNC